MLQLSELPEELQEDIKKQKSNGIDKDKEADMDIRAENLKNQLDKFNQEYGTRAGEVIKASDLII